jgi:hypothetical protein
VKDKKTVAPTPFTPVASTLGRTALMSWIQAGPEDSGTRTRMPKRLVIILALLCVDNRPAFANIQERKQAVKEAKREQRQHKMPKAEKKRLIKKSAG